MCIISLSTYNTNHRIHCPFVYTLPLSIELGYVSIGTACIVACTVHKLTSLMLFCGCEFRHICFSHETKSLVYTKFASRTEYIHFTGSEQSEIIYNTDIIIVLAITKVLMAFDHVLTRILLLVISYM